MFKFQENTARFHVTTLKAGRKRRKPMKKLEEWLTNEGVDK